MSDNAFTAENSAAFCAIIKGFKTFPSILPSDCFNKNAIDFLIIIYYNFIVKKYKRTNL